MAFYSPALTSAVGKFYFRLVRKHPTVHVGMTLVGIAVGVILLASTADDDSDRTLLLVLGIGCLAFYSGLLIHCIIRLASGAWKDFCDWGYSIFN
ncbi:MAG: hypothetical protein ACYS9X_19660 [Planctomycetota bacterium]|jgi:hypothetical protein